MVNSGASIFGKIIYLLLVAPSDRGEKASATCASAISANAICSKALLQLRRDQSYVTLIKNTGVLMRKNRKKLLGSRLRMARLNAKLSQDFTADVLGITRQSVSAWETGASCPSAVQLSELAALYCACAHVLLFGEPYQEVQVDVLINSRLRLA